MKSLHSIPVGDGVYNGFHYNFVDISKEEHKFLSNAIKGMESSMEGRWSREEFWDMSMILSFSVTITHR